MADNARPQKTVTITDNNTGKAINLPVTEGSIGPDVIDIRALYAETGMFTFDPGYGATGSCVSGLTYIDGDEGILLHRGYAIEDLAEKADFLELAYLLLEGELLDPLEKEAFDTAITRHTMVMNNLKTYRGFRRDAHPMAILCGVTEHYLHSIATRPTSTTPSRE